MLEQELEDDTKIIQDYSEQISAYRISFNKKNVLNFKIKF